MANIKHGTQAPRSTGAVRERGDWVPILPALLEFTVHGARCVSWHPGPVRRGAPTATTGLLLTDPLGESVHPTIDIDAIVEASGLLEVRLIEADVASCGLSRDVESGVI